MAGKDSYNADTIVLDFLNKTISDLSDIIIEMVNCAFEEFL